MTDKVFKCDVCGNLASLLEDKGIPLNCCGQPMTELKSMTKESEGNEKHVPVMTIDGNKVKVGVGSTPHPMDQDHHIILIQIMGGDRIIAGVRLMPGEKPEAEFHLESTENISARALCNIHGLWRS